MSAVVCVCAACGREFKRPRSAPRFTCSTECYMARLRDAGTRTDRPRCRCGHSQGCHSHRRYTCCLCGGHGCSRFELAIPGVGPTAPVSDAGDRAGTLRARTAPTGTPWADARRGSFAQGTEKARVRSAGPSQLRR